MSATGIPHPVTDFVVIGRLARLHNLWLVRPGGPIQSVEDLIATSAERPIVIGATEAGGNGFLSGSLGADLLRIDATFIVGYPGTRELGLALLRDEFDVLTGSYDTFFAEIQAGSLRPILQMTPPPSGIASLADVPLLAGADGVAARRASDLGQDEAVAVRSADALGAILGIGRLLVGPRELDPALVGCLQRSLLAVAGDLAEQDASDLSRFVEIDDGEIVYAEFAMAATEMAGFVARLERTLSELRQ
jgi:hypothetical protein